MSLVYLQNPKTGFFKYNSGGTFFSTILKIFYIYAALSFHGDRLIRFANGLLEDCQGDPIVNRRNYFRWTHRFFSVDVFFKPNKLYFGSAQIFFVAYYITQKLNLPHLYRIAFYQIVHFGQCGRPHSYRINFYQITHFNQCGRVPEQI